MDGFSISKEKRYYLLSEKYLILPWGSPDLLPSDITGTKMPVENGAGLRFNPGPVFASLLLADEINRATPKTQSAMLEAMAEKQVTVLGDKWPLMPRENAVEYVLANNHTDQRSAVQAWPFMVLATQNPIEQEGTYNLPEAQADRFRFKVSVTLPEPEHLSKIMNKAAMAGMNTEVQVLNYQKYGFDSALQAYKSIAGWITNVPAMSCVEAHILNVLYATNAQWHYLTCLTDSQKDRLRELAPLIKVGLGPRAAESLILAAKAWSLLLANNDPVADSSALVHVFQYAIAHRLKMREIWDDEYIATAAKSGWMLKELGLLDCAKSKERVDDLANDDKSAKRKSPVSVSPACEQMTVLELFLHELCALTAPSSGKLKYSTENTNLYGSQVRTALKNLSSSR